MIFNVYKYLLEKTYLEYEVLVMTDAIANGVFMMGKMEPLLLFYLVNRVNE